MGRCIGNIYEEKDYSKFKRLEANRAVTEGRVSKLVESLSEKEVMNPIVVNRNMEIIDGQGRFEAKKRLGTPIRYIVDKNATIDDCRRMNKFNSKWCIADYIESYASDGNVNYVRLRDLRDELDISYTRLMIMCGKGFGNDRAVVQSGGLKFTESDAEKVRKVNRMANEILEALVYDKRVSGTFFSAVKVIVGFEGYKHDKILKNCELERYRYRQMRRLEDQLKEFSRIYNRGVRNNRRVHFESYMANKGANVRDYGSMSTNFTGDVSTL